MSRKFEAINLLELRAKGGTQKWNEFLTRCDQNDDEYALGRTLYGIQAGMDDLAKQKLNTPEICEWYARLHRSLEQTAKGIFRRKYKHPKWNVMIAKDYDDAKWRESKKKLQADFWAWMKKYSY